MNNATKVLLTLLFLAVVNPVTISVATIYVVRPELFSQNDCEKQVGIWNRSCSGHYFCKMPKLDK